CHRDQMHRSTSERRISCCLSTLPAAFEDCGSFAKDDLLSQRFRLFTNRGYDAYYAPLAHYFKRNAKLLLVGITPGWTQLQASFLRAHEGLAAGLDRQSIF